MWVPVMNRLINESQLKRILKTSQSLTRGLPRLQNMTTIFFKSLQFNKCCGAYYVQGTVLGG